MNEITTTRTERNWTELEIRRLEEWHAKFPPPLRLHGVTMTAITAIDNDDVDEGKPDDDNTAVVNGGCHSTSGGTDNPSDDSTL